LKLLVVSRCCVFAREGVAFAAKKLAHWRTSEVSFLHTFYKRQRRSRDS
jgi:hypothetical protein